MTLLQISDDNTGKVIDQVGKVVEKTFDLNPTSVYGVLVGILFLAVVVLIFALRSKDKTIKESYDARAAQTQSFADTFAMIQGNLSSLTNIQNDIVTIKNHIVK